MLLVVFFFHIIIIIINFSLLRPEYKLCMCFCRKCFSSDWAPKSSHVPCVPLEFLWLMSKKLERDYYTLITECT